MKALELDDALASAHYALATAHTWYDWDWAGAEREFRRGLELNPNDALGRNWHGGYLSLLGRHDEAIAEHQRARDLDPLSLIVNANLTRALYWARRYDDAIAQARRTLELDPGFGVALFWLEGSLRHKGLLDEAVALRQSVVHSRTGAEDCPHVSTRRVPGAPPREWRAVQEERNARGGCPLLRADRRDG